MDLSALMFSLPRRIENVGALLISQGEENKMDIDLSYQLNGETHYYKNVWEKIQDEHYPECPVSIGAGHQRKSTCCLCDKIAIANKSADECVRCHNLVEACACGVKAQLI